MRLLAEIRERLRTLFFRRREEAELDEELRFHLQMQVEEHLRRGVDGAEARRRARIELGGVERTKEEVRDARGTRWMEETILDVRRAVRDFARAPAFTAAVVCTVAVGIGAAATLFSLYDAAFLRVLPYPESDRLVALWQDHAGRDGAAEEPFNPPDFQFVRERASTLELAAGFSWTPTLTDAGPATRLRGARVSSGYFRVLGAVPAVGRLFGPGDETPVGAPVVVLGHELWSTRFGGDSTVVGRRISLDGDGLTVVGVAPRGFRAPGRDVEVWRPMPGAEADGGGRRFRILDVIGRLAPGATLSSASAELASLASRLGATYPETNAGVRFRAASLHDRTVGAMRPTLAALAAAVALVLLLACANVANLLLARGIRRRRETAVRMALGARRMRVVRRLAAEALVIGLAGGAIGLLLAVGGVEALGVLVPREVLGASAFAVDARVAGCAVALSLATAIAFALPPALRLADVDAAGVLRGTGARGGSRRAARARGVLVTAEIALALGLAVGAGLLLRSFAELDSLDPGFRSGNALVAEVALPDSRYGQAEAVTAFHRELERRVEALPGVRAFGAVSALPLRGSDRNVSLRIEGRETDSPALAWYRIATPEYFPALGIPLRAGRLFDDGDSAEAPNAVLVNETFAERFLSGDASVGRRVSPDWADGEWFTIVGVVGDVRHRGLTRSAAPELYHPLAQLARASTSMALVAHTTGDPSAFAPILRETVAAIDGDLPVDRITTMDALIAKSIALPRLALSSFGAFAAIALLLAGIGIFGVVSTAVAQRTPEIGVRLALGARPADIVRLVLRRTLTLIAGGLVLGLVLGLVTARTLESLLHEVSPTDPSALAGAAAVLLCTSVLAAVAPVVRAARVQPTRVLQAD